MNKFIAITQRLDHIKDYNELRDCLDVRWYSFLKKINYSLIPLPNLSTAISLELLNKMKINGIILSGGNSLSSYSSNNNIASKIRDRFERKLIKFSLDNNIPILGVCRGMQMLNVYFKGSLISIKDGKKRHKLISVKNKFKLPENVNSFHDWGISKETMSKNLTAIAHDTSNNIEAFMHKKKKIIGIMWHPERDYKFNKENLNLIKDFFK